MGSGALTPVSKGRLIQAIDARLKSPRREYLDELEKGSAELVEIGLDTRIVNTPKVEEHVRTEIFGSWWPDVALKPEIIRSAYIQAMRVALAPLDRRPPDPPKPIVTYWVKGMKNFELMVAESEQQVTVFLLTPDHPAHLPPPAPADVQENLWVIAPDARIAELRATFPKDYNLEPPETLGRGVQAQRVRGY
jgi:hypothetical protein